MDCKDVHILFCDQDPKSASETLFLIQKCGYKVTAVKSGRKVIEILESAKSDVDIILFDVELPGEKGFKMLKHVMRRDELNHIAVVVMSAQHEMAVVAKCLQLGAVDYLVKPLRLNEVMNLWTHMWRRRRMLGLPEKHAVMDIINTNSPSLGKAVESLSHSKDNTIDKDLKDHLKAGTSTKLELSLRLSNTYDVGKTAGDLTSPCSIPKQIAGRRSAFSAYSKPNNAQASEQSANMCSPSSSSLRSAGKFTENLENGLTNSTREVCSNTDTLYGSAKGSCMAVENKAEDTESLNCNLSTQHFQNNGTSKSIFGSDQTPSQNVPNIQQRNGFTMCPSRDIRQGSTSNVQESSEMVCSSQASMQQLPSFYNSEGNIAISEATSSMFSYYPVGQMVLPQYMGFSSWPTMVTTAHVVGNKTQQSERREAALQKFRMKRKGRCFEKKIRYVSRKKLAEQRPRVRGQFVKRTAIIDSQDSDQHPTVGSEYRDEEEGEADDEQGFSEMDTNSSPECLDGRNQVG